MTSLRVSVRCIGKVVSPMTACTAMTGRRSTLPFDDLTLRKSMMSASTRTLSRVERWCGCITNVAVGPWSDSMTRRRKAWSADVVAPVSIFTFTGVGQRSGMTIHSRQPIGRSCCLRGDIDLTIPTPRGAPLCGGYAEVSVWQAGGGDVLGYWRTNGPNDSDEPSRASVVS